MIRIRRLGLLVALGAVSLAVTPALAAKSAEDLAKLAQNPIANLISLPFQDNVNFNQGDLDGTQNVLNIQPVVPFSLGEHWNVITRTILPVITQPATSAATGVSGLGDLQVTGFLSPAKPWKNIVMGGGVIVQAPTHTDGGLGNDHWGMGPSFVALHVDSGSPWVFGALVNNVWSLGSSSDPGYSNFLLQPFVNYNFEAGFYLVSAPIMTAAWEAASGERWVVPVGGGIGKVFHLGRLPVNSQVSAYYNAVRPTDGADWQLRLQVQLMFPK